MAIPKIKTFEIAGWKYIIEDNETLIMLTHGDVTATTTGISAHNPDGTNYQVPSGKTFTILGIKWKGQGSRTMTIYEANTADSTVGEVDKFQLDDSFGQDGFKEIATPYLPVIPASHFVNLKTSSTSSSWRHVFIFGVELN